MTGWRPFVYPKSVCAALVASGWLLLAWLAPARAGAADGPPEPARFSWSCEGDGPELVEAAGGPSLRARGGGPVPAAEGPGWRLDGVSFLEVPMDLDGWISMTAALWVRPAADLPKQGACLLDASHAGHRNLAIQTAGPLRSKKVRKDRLWTALAGNQGLSFELPAGRWTHLSLVADGLAKEIRLYRDGARIGRVPLQSPFRLDAPRIVIGRWTDRDEGHFRGDVRGVSLWDRPLSDAEIARLGDFPCAPADAPPSPSHALEEGARSLEFLSRGRTWMGWFVLSSACAASLWAFRRVPRLARAGGLLLEAAALASLLAGYLWIYRRVLFDHAEIFPSGDSIFWYGAFQHFVECLKNGSLALWNPYMHGGEPFFYVWGMTRLLDPVTLAVALVGAGTDLSILHLYHINYVVRVIVCFAGTYLCLARLLSFRLSRLVVFALVFLGSFNGELYDIGRLDAYCWTPWGILFLLRGLDGGGRRDLLGFAYVLGITMGASVYHGVYPLFSYLLLAAILAFRSGRALWRWIAADRRGLLLAALLFTGLCAPLFAIYPERAKIIPTLRASERDVSGERSGAIGVTYKVIEKGARKGVGLGIPSYLKDQLHSWPAFGLLFFWGLLAGRHRLYVPFVVFFFLSYVMYMGPEDSLPGLLRFVHRVLWHAFPPMTLVRHSVFFSPITFFAMAVMAGWGMDAIVSWARSGAPVRGTRWALAAGALWIAWEMAGSARSQPTPMILLALACPFARLLPAMRKDASRAAPGGAARGIALAGAVLGGILSVTLGDLGRYGGSGTQPRAALLAALPFDPNARPFRLPETRELSCGLTGHTMNYNSILLRRSTLIEEVIPVAGGAPSPIDNFREPFPTGLHYFWLKSYLALYEIAERNPDVFFTVAGVGEPLVAFRPEAFLFEEKGLRRFLSEEPPERVDPLLARAVFLTDRTADARPMPAEPPPQTAEAGFSWTPAASFPASLDLEVRNDAPGFLLYRDGFDAHWRATVDGRPAEIHRADLGFKAVRLGEAGFHRVRFEYRPYLFLAAVALYACLVVLAPLAGLVARFRDYPDRP